MPTDTCAFCDNTTDLRKIKVAIAGHDMQEVMVCRDCKKNVEKNKETDLP